MTKPKIAPDPSWHEPASTRALEVRIAELEGALRVICTWATFRDGMALAPIDVAALCRQALRMRTEDGA